MRPSNGEILRDNVELAVKKIGRADILVGIPALNNENTIVHVVKTVGKGTGKITSAYMIAAGLSKRRGPQQYQAFPGRSFYVSLWLC